MDNGTILYIIAGIISLFGLVFAFSGRKKIMDKSKWLFAIPFLLVGFGLIAMQTGFLQQWTGSDTFAPLAVAGAGAEVSTIPVTIPISGLCPPGSVEDVTVKVTGINKYTQLATGGNHAYKLNSGPWSTVADEGTFTASAGAILDMFWNNGSLDSNYFSEKETIKLSCSDGAPSYKRELVQNGTATIEVFNEEQNLIDGLAENETLGIGDVVTLDAKFKATYQRGFPHGGILVVEYNSTTYDDVIVDFGNTVPVTTPTYYTVIQTSNIAKSYVLPPVLSTDVLIGKITIDVGPTYNPHTTGFAGANNMTLTWYPYNLYKDEDAGSIIAGPSAQDEKSKETFNYKKVFQLHVN